MQLKPNGLDRRYAEQFCDASIVEAYTARPPYPLALDRLFVELAGGDDSHILDLGCGTGELSRRLAPRVQAVTAVDQSEKMIARARSLPGGDAPNIAWVVGRVEDVSLSGPFSAMLAAQSFHWFDWAAMAPRLAAWLPSRRLIITDRREGPAPWSETLAGLYSRYSTNKDFEPFDLVEELTGRGYLKTEGRISQPPQPFTQSIDDYLTAIHSQNGFSRERMTVADADAFDEAIRAAVGPHASDGLLTIPVLTRVVWGRLEAE